MVFRGCDCSSTCLLLMVHQNTCRHSTLVSHLTTTNTRPLTLLSPPAHIAPRSLTLVTTAVCGTCYSFLVISSSPQQTAVCWWSDVVLLSCLSCTKRDVFAVRLPMGDHCYDYYYLSAAQCHHLITLPYKCRSLMISQYY